MAKSSGADTPVMRQYLAAKAAHPDALVFFRLGDFYEIFFDDAVVAAKALDLTLTSRNKNAEEPIPMAGVPYHAASGYVQRLLDLGHKVAICEQMGDPSKIKGIVPREVVRIATPALAFDDSALDAKKNLFLAGVEVDTLGRVGIAWLDFSTGTLEACEVEGIDAAVTELVRLDPREVLVHASSEIAQVVRGALVRATVRQEAEGDLDLHRALGELDEVLGKGEARKSCASDLALVAAARCVALVKACEPGRNLPVARLVETQIGDTLILDDAAQRHLELVRTMDGETKGSLLAHIDATRTAPGARLLRRRLLAPRTNVAEIRRRLDGVELFVTQPGLRAEIRARLDRVADLERLAVKLAVDRVGPRELAQLRTSLDELPHLDDALAQCPDKAARDALEIPTNEPFVDRCEDLAELLHNALSDELPLRASDGGVFRDGWDGELDEARTLTRDGQRLIVQLEGRLREMSQIPSLKLRYTRVFGWYMEVTKTHLAKAPSSWRRKQTIATGERFTCDDLDALADKLAHAEERLSTREAELWSELVKNLAAHVERLRAIAARVAHFDVASALAEVAHRDDYTRPDVNENTELLLEQARHPVVEHLAAAGHFVPNDVVLAALDANEEAPEDRARLWIITGPNMAGKSTFMRQVALAVVLAQAGSFVPARRARVGIVDRILTRVGASDNLARGESTFMVEMKETANILRRATRRSLVILDEIGRGTSTYDGLAIAWAVAEHLHDVASCRALFATHYYELTELTSSCPRAQNHSVSAREHEGSIVFFHKVQQGAASRSYGVACARLAGIPEPVLARAKAMLDALEQGRGVAQVLPRHSRTRANVPQLDLFGKSDRVRDADIPTNPALEMLRALDLDRMTPLEALTTLAKLKSLL
ncbi:MAG: DNA mismatch repair protein MutS [Polyangiaceae bacterium]|nr:DNA mismatch repair protein MutS [Polyangiaceae bacterium]